MLNQTEPRAEYVETQHGRFHCLDWGERPNQRGTLLLLHAITQTAHSWDEVAPILAAEYRVVAIDQRGHGETGVLTVGDYARETMTDDVARIAEALGLRTFALIGASMGASHALVCANRHSSAVSCIVIVDWAPQLDPGGIAGIRAIFETRWNSFDEAVAQVHAFNPRRSVENIRARLAHTLGQLPDGRWGWKVDHALFDHPRFRDPPDVLWRYVEKVPCHALVVRGNASDLFTEELAEEMTRRLPHAELATIPDAGHSVAGDQPAAFCGAVLPFLRRHSS